jgi:predicted enzyme related to lactoylglutathione lyase
VSTTVHSVVIPVTDLAAAKAIYTPLFGEPHTDMPFYVGYNVGGFEIALNPANETEGPVVFTNVDEVDTTRQTLLDAGATEVIAPREVAPGNRITVLADKDGNLFGLGGA